VNAPVFPQRNVFFGATSSVADLIASPAVGVTGVSRVASTALLSEVSLVILFDRSNPWWTSWNDRSRRVPESLLQRSFSVSIGRRGSPG